MSRYRHTIPSVPTYSTEYLPVGGTCWLGSGPDGVGGVWVASGAFIVLDWLRTLADVSAYPTYVR